MAPHGVGVDLAHVVAAVAAADVADVQCPCVRVAVHDREPGVVG